MSGFDPRDGYEERKARRRRFFDGNATHRWYVLSNEDAYACADCPAKATGRTVLMEPDIKLEPCP